MFYSHLLFIISKWSCGFGISRGSIWVSHIGKHSRFTTNRGDDSSIRHRADRRVPRPQSAKDRHHRRDYTRRCCLLRLFRFESWRVEKPSRPIRTNGSSLRNTSHRHPTAGHRVHSRLSNRLHILMNTCVGIVAAASMHN